MAHRAVTALGAAARPRWGDAFAAAALLAAITGAGLASTLAHTDPRQVAGAVVAGACAGALVWIFRDLGMWMWDGAQRLGLGEKSSHEAGAAYERQVAAILDDEGWSVRFTPPGPDKGLDLIARKSGRTVAIQCKRYSSSVGSSAVQEIVAARVLAGHDADAAVIASAPFTRSARALAAVNGVALAHHNQLGRFEAMIRRARDKSAARR